MLQRSLLTTTLAVLGLVAFALGIDTDILLSASRFGQIFVSRHVLIVLAAISVVLAGAWPTRGHSLVSGLQGALPPVLLTAGIFLALPALGWKTGGAVLAVSLPVVILMQAWSAAEESRKSIAALARLLACYLSALAVFVGVLTWRPPLYILVPTTGAIAGLLFLLRWGAEVPSGSPTDLALSAFVAALVVAEASVPIAFWQAPPLVGGLALLALFYAATGLAVAGLSRQTNWLVLVEYTLVGSMAIAGVIWFALAVR